MCCSGWACLPAWGQLGSWALWSEAPLGSPDWLESHLPNRLAPCHQTMEQQRGLGGVKGEKELLYDRERRGTSVRGKERKMSLPMYVRWQRLCCSNLGLLLRLSEVKKKKHSDCVGKSAQVNMKALQWDSGDTYSIKLYLFSADLHPFQNTDIQTNSKKKKTVTGTDMTRTCKKQNSHTRKISCTFSH